MQRSGQRQPARGGEGWSGQGSVLPALMSNPWLMTNAFMANPFGFADAMRQEMDRLFSSSDWGSSAGSRGEIASGNRGLARQPAFGTSRWAPQTEIYQRGNELVVSADLPGVRPEDVNVEVEDGILTISGERRQSRDDSEEGYYQSERSYGSFVRSYALPDGVDENQVHAHFDHGVLEVTVPMPQQQTQRRRRIEVHSAGAHGEHRAQVGQGAQSGQSARGTQGAQSGRNAEGAHGTASTQGEQSSSTRSEERR